MYLIEPIANLIGSKLDDVVIPFELSQDFDAPEYFDSKEHGLQLLIQDGIIHSVFFFLEKFIAEGNEVVARPWETSLGLNNSSSRTVVRSIYGKPIEYSEKLQVGYAGGYTGWWDKFPAPWGVIHATYGSDLNSTTLIVCGAN